MEFQVGQNLILAVSIPLRAFTAHF